MKLLMRAKRIIACALVPALFCAFLFSCTLMGSARKGDCNKDDRINAIDSNYLARLVLGENVIVSAEGADLNSDNNRGDADLSLLRQYHAGTFRPGSRFSKIFVNGIDISNYVVIIPEKATDFEKWTAEILSDSIMELSGKGPQVLSDKEPERPCEILIGETKRRESREIPKTDDGYAIFARGSKIVMGGENYLVAAGAGYMISALESLTVEWNLDAHIDVPRQAKKMTVEWREGENVIFFIGDGMGFNHTKMATDPDCRIKYSDGTVAVPEEAGIDIFWPATFEHAGDSTTLNIFDSTTDSAAGATALATGYKTSNGALGMIPADLDGDGKEDEFRTVQNVREAATLAGKATAVVSTDRQSGGTPNAFLVHHYTRTEKKLILEQQKALDSTRLDCTYLWCSYDSDDVFKNFKKAIDECDDNPGGFFIMTEEAMIDKYAEKMDFENVIRTVKRLNKMTAYAATYAMCHTDTVVVLTADHETGGLTPDLDGAWYWSSDGEHTGTNVPVFAMGYGTEYFDSSTRDNTDIARFLFDTVR